MSNGAALSVVLAVWAVTGAVFVLLAMAAMVVGPSADSSEWLLRSYESLTYGVALLGLFTTVIALVWAVQASVNVPRIGRSAHFGQVPIVMRHLPIGIVGSVLVALAPRVEVAEQLMRVLGGLAMIWGLLLPAALGHGLLSMLWRSSAMGESSKEKPNQEITIWFVGLCIFVAASAGREFMSGMSVQAEAFLAFLTGLGILLAAVTGFRFIPTIAERQEARMFAILNSFGVDESADASPVTAQQIQDAWAASSELFTVDGH
ncbi:MAG: hypothetical protein HKN03_11420 [Acidimicrobiales bacterium]|nr:hypothetical protein [Acidimicrobiales bacterium]